MQDGFGIVSPVSGPVLDRIPRDERLGRDNPRRDRDEKPKPEGLAARRDDEAPAESEPERPSRNHIDLRI